MRLFKRDPTQTLRRSEKSVSERTSTADYVLERLNRLETRVEQLELVKHEQHMLTLNAVEKVIHQLEARTRKRERQLEEQDADETPEPRAAQGDSSVLSRRFRRF